MKFAFVTLGKNMSWVGLYILLFLLSFMLTYFLRRYACMDVPNERSSHLIPTPRGGGLAIVISFMLGLGVCFYKGVIDEPLFKALLFIWRGIASLGFIDDHTDLSDAIKFSVQFLLTMGALWLLGAFKLDVLVPFAVFYVLWVSNLYNF